MAGLHFRAAHLALKLPQLQLHRPPRLVSNKFCRLHCPSQVLEQRPSQRGLCVSSQWSKQRGRAGHSLTAPGAGRQLVRDHCQALASFAASVSNMADIESMDPVQKRLMFDDECILVDGDDQVVGHENKYNCHLWEKIESENLLHRAFSTFLFNSENKLLLQKRSATKVTFPLVWTNTCCSHPLYRESEMIAENDLGVKNAAVRKLYDELGIVAEDVPVSDFTCLGRIHYKAPSDGKWGEHEVDYLLFIKRDVRLEPNPDEVAEVEFVDRERLRELVRKADANEDGIKLSPWFRLVVDRFLFDWWDRVERGTLEEAVDMKTIHKL